MSTIEFPHLTDREGVREEAARQWGGLSDAAAFLQVQRAGRDPNVEAALKRKVNPTETAKVQDDLSLAQDKVDAAYGEGKYTVIDAAVRGNDHLSVVAEDAFGQTQRLCVGWTDAFRPILTPADKESERLNAHAAAASAQLSAEARAEVARQVAEARQEIEAQVAEQVAKALAGIESQRSDASEKLAEGEAGADDEGGPKYPHTQDDLNALAEAHAFEWPDGVTKVKEKQKALRDAGIEPDEE